MILPLPLAAVALASATAVPPEFDPAVLPRIAKSCEIPSTWLTIGNDGLVRFHPGPTARYVKVHCVLEQLRNYHAPMKTGIVGNGR